MAKGVFLYLFRQVEPLKKQMVRLKIFMFLFIMEKKCQTEKTVVAEGDKDNEIKEHFDSC